MRVRILLDDLDIAGEQDNVLDALDAHPNIEVRLFNPFHIRNRSIFSKAGQFLVDGQRLNRRMHNKSFIVDGMQASSAAATSAMPTSTPAIRSISAIST